MAIQILIPSRDRNPRSNLGLPGGQFWCGRRVPALVAAFDSHIDELGKRHLGEFKFR